MTLGSTLTLVRLGLEVKVVGQRSRSNAKNCVLTSLLPCFKVKVKVKGQVQRSGSKFSSKVRPIFWHAAVDIRGSALPSSAKSKEGSLSDPGVFSVCRIVMVIVIVMVDRHLGKNSWIVGAKISLKQI